MQIDRLSLRGFRNYEDAQAQFVPGVNLLVGGNANGKTNLLEAVSYLSTGRSFRTRREAELIRFGADFAELRAQVQSQERTRELRAVLFSGRRPRQLWLAGVRQRSRAALSGVLTRGQTRTAVISLKLAEREIFHDEFDETPCSCSTTCCPSWMPGGRTLF